MTIGDELTKKGLSLIQPMAGEVWTLKDEQVQFPGRDEKGIPKGKKRYVLILQNDADNGDSDFLTVTVAPFTTVLNSRTKQCMILDAGEGGLTERSVLKLDLIQPVLKNLLHSQKGRLTDARLFQVRTRIAKNLGLI